MSAQVRWFDFHLWAQQYLDAAGDYPAAGTQAWFDLDDTDPRKWAAVLSAASHHTLRVETCQVAECEASHAVSAAADWSAVARGQLRHANAVASGAYIPRKAAVA